jgi:2'-5' RNA ligase
VARLFFALWPTEDSARALEACASSLAERLGGRPMAIDKIHLTLAFLGEVPAERAGLAVEAGHAARGRAFSLVLDRLGAFRRAGVAWAGASRVEPELLQLQGSLAAALGHRGFVLEARPFNPHVTLVRKVERALRDEAVQPVAWRVSDFALMRSDPRGGRYEMLERWGLE